MNLVASVKYCRDNPHSIVVTILHDSGNRYMSKFYSYAHIPILILVIVTTIYYFNFTAEDAYITYRYAENFVNIGSLVYNVGEPINAMTSPLHAILRPSCLL